jgi:uncharacterized damage-inducible protein DinB
MSNLEFFKARRAAELPAFRSVLAALSKDRFDYRPHDRSPSAAQLVWTLALETKACCAFVDEGRVEWAHVDPPSDPAALVDAFDTNYRELDARVSKLDEAKWNEPVKLLVGGEVKQEAPLGQMLWYLFFDAIHHRGQLSTYIRPMGGKVPAIYGPSGDDPGQ